MSSSRLFFVTCLLACSLAHSAVPTIQAPAPNCASSQNQTSGTHHSTPASSAASSIAACVLPLIIASIILIVASRRTAALAAAALAAASVEVGSILWMRRGAGTRVQVERRLGSAGMRRREGVVLGVGEGVVGVGGARRLERPGVRRRWGLGMVVGVGVGGWVAVRGRGRVWGWRCF